MLSASVTMWESARLASSPALELDPVCCRRCTFAAPRDSSLPPSWSIQCIWIPCEIRASSRAGALPLPLPSTSLTESVRTPPSWETPSYRWLPGGVRRTSVAAGWLPRLREMKAPREVPASVLSSCALCLELGRRPPEGDQERDRDRGVEGDVERALRA